MNKTLLIIGIIITSISLLAITIFSISNAIYKKLNKEKELNKTEEQKQHDKTVKKVLKNSKKIIKKINKKLIEHYVAIYVVTAITLTGGVVLTSITASNIINENSSSSVEPEPGPEPEPTVITYNVTWKDENGTILLKNTVDEGHVPSYTLDLPYKENYVFDSWSPQPSVVNSDVEYVASYRNATEEITLKLYSDYYYQEDYRELNVLEGTRLIDHRDIFEVEFANPDRSYKLDKLYSNPTLSGDPYNLNAPITNNLDIYASYYKEWIVTYNVGGGAVDLERVKEGECAKGHVWQYEDYTWFDRENPSFPFDFANTPIYSDYLLDGYMI